MRASYDEGDPFQPQLCKKGIYRSPKERQAGEVLANFGLRDQLQAARERSIAKPSAVEVTCITSCEVFLFGQQNSAWIEHGVCGLLYMRSRRLPGILRLLTCCLSMAAKIVL